ncbi:MAG TPA: hypothetical protein H9741_01255 [Candidatus Borkfalkia faecipullorum]|uniref:Uncharacterized protein n=1 Tax=Candidatus Borkfalkia faecipullorum TaxID=2838510 RepID=A0A9D1V6P8_9FIRM|nr:hypothetical protein [Candidatus Borkfalkia faecipullorum]
MCKNKRQNKKPLGNMDIVNSFRESISADLDCLSDFSESMIDLFISNPIVQAIPIINLGRALCKGVQSFSSYFQQKKLIMFLSALRACEDTKSVEKMRTKILNNPKYLYKESELLLAILYKAVEANKSILLAKIFAALIKDSFTEEIYFELVLIVDQIFLSDIDMLKKVQEEKNDDITLIEISSLNRLESNGLIYQCTLNANRSTYADYALSDIGEKLCSIIL